MNLNIFDTIKGIFRTNKPDSGSSRESSTSTERVPKNVGSGKTAVLLGYGFTAQALDRALSEDGYDTIGVRRNWDDKLDENLQSQAIEADVTDRASLDNLPEDPDVLINCVSSGARGDAERYRKVYLDGAKNLVDWAKENDPGHLIWTSSSSVYGQQNGAWVNEEDETDPESETGQILVDAEAVYRSARREGSFDVTILRLTGIYGEGRARSLDMYLDDDTTLALEKANKYLNMIHRDDIAEVVLDLLGSDKLNETYNVTDDEPVMRRRFYVWLSQQLDRPLPKISGSGQHHPPGNKRVSNKKLREELDVTLNYPTYREGYERIMRDRNLLS